jgi:hypothetical protein
MSDLFDSTSSDRPAGFEAGYDDGRYANWAQVVARYGAEAVLDITVNPADDEGNCLDIENGDARPADAPGWTARARARGVKVVWNYLSLDNWQPVLAAYHWQRLPLPDRWWIADYTGRPHFPTFGNLVASACQYEANVKGPQGLYDVSCVAPDVFTARPAPPAGPSLKELSMYACFAPNGNLVIVGEAADNGDLMVFEKTGAAWSVTDVTDAIHAEAPGDARTYRVH